MMVRVVELPQMTVVQTLALREVNWLRRKASVLTKEGRESLRFAQLMPKAENNMNWFEGLYKHNRAKRLRQIANRLELAHVSHRAKKMAGVAAPAGA